MRDITVKYYAEPEGVWATSDDLDGLAVAGSTLAEVRALVREGIGVYLNGEDVDLREVLPTGFSPQLTMSSVLVTGVGHSAAVAGHLEMTPTPASLSFASSAPSRNTAACHGERAVPA